MNANIGKRIKLKRVEKGLTQRELAKKMGYSNHSTLARIESGKVDISQTRLAQFANELNVDVGYLMGWEWDSEEDKEKKPAETSELSENQKMLIEFVRSVPDDKAALVLRTMKAILEDD